MNSLDLMSIKNKLEKTYDFKIDDIKHIRSMIGHVYTLKNEKHRFILKLNRPKNENSAIQATEIIEYLNEKDYPVVELFKTRNNENYFDFNTEEGKYIGFVYYYVEGKEPNIEKEVKQIGQQIGLFHNLMEVYQKPIIQRSKDFYIDRFIKILIKSDYDKNKIEELNDYGKELWNKMEKSKNGICHGDLHSGNMFLKNGNYILFDFDTSSYSFPIIDVATLCDTTNFNNLIERDFDKIMKMFDKFYDFYIKERTLEDKDIKNIFSFIPIRHYELIATITINQKSELQKEFLDQQHGWLMKWKELCNKKI